LSISQPHFPQVPPPQSACLNDFGWRTCGVAEPQTGQSTGRRLTPHRFLVTVPNTTNKRPRKRTEKMTMNITFITRSGIITSSAMSSSTPTAKVSRMALRYFMRRLHYAPPLHAIETVIVDNRALTQPIRIAHSFQPSRASQRALSSRTGTLTLCCTRMAVVPKARSANSLCPWVPMATRSQPFSLTHLVISLAGSP